MEFEKVTLWGLNKNQRWVKRRSFDYTDEFIWNRRQFAAPYEEKHGTIHAFFPIGINPNEHPIIFDMYDIIQRKVKAYQTDFFYHDCISYFKHDQDTLWLVRETGTFMFGVSGEYEDEDSKKINIGKYRYNEGCDYRYYRIQKDKINKIPFEKGLELLNNKPVQITEKASA